jgi:hypothetical protein
MYPENEDASGQDDDEMDEEPTNTGEALEADFFQQFDKDDAG